MAKSSRKISKTLFRTKTDARCVVEGYSCLAVRLGRSSSLKEKGKGSEQEIPFTVDMNKLFERFVEEIIREEAQRAGYQLGPQAPRYLTEKIPIRPDLVLRRGGRISTGAAIKSAAPSDRLAMAARAAVAKTKAATVAASRKRSGWDRFPKHRRTSRTAAPRTAAPRTAAPRTAVSSRSGRPPRGWSKGSRSRGSYASSRERTGSRSV